MEWAKSRASAWKQYLVNGEREAHYIHQLAGGSGCAIDVGANGGYYSYFMRRAGLDVVAFEPNPRFAKRLKVIGAKVEQVALSDRCGTASLTTPMRDGFPDPAMASLLDLANIGDGIADRMAVRTMRLDDYTTSNVRIIKVDVEGHEEAVLAGAVKTILRDLPVLIVECEERHNKGGLPRLTKVLSTMGYAGRFMTADGWCPISSFCHGQHQNFSNLNHSRWRRHDRYINNFVFQA